MAGSGFNTRTVRELAKILRDNDLTEIEVDHDGTRITISRTVTVAQQVQVPVQQVMAPVASSANTAPAATAPAVAAPVAPAAASGPTVGSVPSPMVGTIYLQAEPGSPAFIKLGDTVSEGQQLFIIEAMKTMNPVVAPHAGTVKAILVTDSQPVEYGEALCVIS